MDVSLTGGEALLRPDIFELIDSVIANRMRYNLLSNGTVIDEKLLHKFEQGKRRLRLDFIQVSIDGSRAVIHDKSRPGSFDRALRGLKLLKEASFPIAVRVTINRHNLSDLENIAKLLLEDIGLNSFATNDAMPIGSGCRSDAEMALSAKEKMLAMAAIGRLQRRYPGRLEAQAGPQAKRAMYAEMVHARRTGEKPHTWTMGYLTACGCVFSKIDILHDGSVVPCCMLPGMVTRQHLQRFNSPYLALSSGDDRPAGKEKHPLEKRAGMRELRVESLLQWQLPGVGSPVNRRFQPRQPEDCFRDS